MKRKRKISRFKKWEDKFKKIKLNKDRLTLLALIMGGILVVSFLGFYFKSLIEKERLEMKKDLEKIIWQLEKEVDSAPLERIEEASPETLHRLRESGIERYFLSEVELIGVHYTPILHACLYEKEKPIYFSYVYETWSLVDYPESKPEIALIRYLLLPEDNSDFQPNKTCYIKEIKSEKDWQELKEKYNFSRDQFSPMP